MVATLCLCCCVLATAQPADRSEWLVTPRLGRAQELVYRGTFNEEASGGGVQFSRAYRLESRVFVLETPPQGAEVAFLTVVKVRTPQQAGTVRGAGEDPALWSVRLEQARVDLQGRVTADPGVPLGLALDGPPAIECGAFVEVPRGRVAAGQSWEVNEDGRPSRTWRAAGTEMVNGTSCLKLIGLQQSDDWDRPRADSTAWRRQDTVWLAAPRQGIAYRVERVIERREPARQEPTQRSTLRYELESSLQYPGQLYGDRRREIVQTRAFAESAAPLLATPTKFAPQLEALATKINHHLETQPPTPYREAMLQVKRRVEAGRRGESPPAPPASEQPRSAMVATVGQPAPDFVAPDFTTRELTRLRRWHGRPVLMVFYNPTSKTAEELLQFAQTIHTGYPEQVAVVALAMSDDAERVRKQFAELRLPFPVLNGTGLRISYAVDATPRLMVLDADGVVRGSYVGWGTETSIEVVEELKRWLPKK